MVEDIYPDLILLDVSMPTMDGIEVLRRVKNISKNASIPVVMLSARSESNYIFRAQEVGAVDYVIKPFDQEDLLNVIRKYMR